MQLRQNLWKKKMYMEIHVYNFISEMKLQRELLLVKKVKFKIQFQNSYLFCKLQIMKIF